MKREWKDEAILKTEQLSFYSNSLHQPETQPDSKARNTVVKLGRSFNLQ